MKCTGGLTRGRVFEENVRNIWIMTIGHSAAFHESMIKLLGVSVGWRDQNIDVEMKRCNCDNDQSQKIFSCFKIRNPFNIKDGNLYFLLPGLVLEYGKEPVNCDQA